MQNTKPTHDNGSLSSDEATSGVESANSKHLLNNGASGSAPGGSLIALALDEREAKFLKGLGYDDERIVAFAANRRRLRSSGSHAKKAVVTADMIAAHAVEIIEMAGGKPLLAGKSVGLALVRLGLIPRPRGFNACGDKCGGHGLQLPVVNIGGKAHYDLSYCTRSAADREARQAELTALDLDLLRMAVGEITEETPSETPGETANGTGTAAE